MKQQLNSYLKKLAKILSSPKDRKEMEAFLGDFLAPSEVKQLVERWLIGDLLLKGSTHRNVKQKLGVSITKVSRGANVLQYGRGGFRRALQTYQQRSAD